MINYNVKNRLKMSVIAKCGLFFLSLALSISLLSSCFSLHQEKSKMIVGKEALEVFDELSNSVETIFEENDFVAMHLLYASSENEGYNKAMIFGIVEKRLIGYSYYNGAKNIGALQDSFSSNTTHIIASFQNKGLFNINQDNNANYYFSGVEDLEHGNLDHLLNFDLKLEDYKIAKVTQNINSKDVTYYKFFSEIVPENPLLSLVLDYYGIEYYDDYFEIRYNEDQIILIVKIKNGNEDLLLSMVIIKEDNSNIPAVIKKMLGYLDTRHPLESFNEWPNYYKEELDDYLKGIEVPVPNGVSMYNELVFNGEETCVFVDYVPNEAFISNYEKTLLRNGFLAKTDEEKVYYKNVNEEENKTIWIILNYDEGIGATITMSIKPKQ
ncbi:MAG: hypothetical protein K6F14_00060 [Clostridiales bacterium]|nr:hypothetical protein [Clostridiales bacterium]